MERPLLLQNFISRADGPAGESEFVISRVHLDTIAFFELSFEDLNRQRVLNQTLDRSLERACAVDRIVPLVRQ